MNNTTQNTPLGQHIEAWERRYDCQFEPRRPFFRRMNIGQRRFQLIKNGKTDPTTGEVLALSEYFGVAPETFYQKPTVTP